MIRSPDPLANPEPLIARVYAYVAYRLGEGPDAEDVTSETFERALRFLGSYRANRGEPIAWLIGIARRCIADSRSAPRAAEPADAASPEDIEEEAVRRLDLLAAVERLPERDRELVALRYGADLTAKQIARVVGSRTNTVEVALHRALARLRADIGGEELGPPELQALRRVRI